MADTPKGTNRGLLITLAVALAVVVVAIWLLGGFGGGEDENTRTTYEAGVTDEGGGELIVTDPDAPGVEDVTLPETPMTPVPPGEEDGAEPSPAPAE